MTPTILFLTSALLDDRKLLYSKLLSCLDGEAVARVWATSFAQAHHKPVWALARANVEPFPGVGPYRELFNYLRRLNDFAWDYATESPTRLSVRRHLRQPAERWRIKALRPPARAIATLGLEVLWEQLLRRALVRQLRSPEATHRLQAVKPAVVVATGPNRFEEPAVAAAAMARGIPVLAAIHSWDNLTTKSRMVLQYDGYLVWSEQMKQELFRICPESRTRPVYVVGALQFDVFFQDRFKQSREEFCRGQSLDPSKPIIVYALGSPNLIREHYGVIAFAERLNRGELGDAQVLVRPHPMFDNGQEARILTTLGPQIKVQRTGEPGASISARTQDSNQITEWVNTFRHADVVVNLSSTVAIDAAICDRPIVNLDFDPEPGQPQQALVKDVNHVWSHFKPIAESGGLWLANDMNEVVHAVREYLSRPELHRDRRRWMAQYVCGFIDGGCGERMANAILEFCSERTYPDPARG